ncbi:MAG: DUF4332 domain-containing protein [Elainellaceae cyanobacterium]
MPSSWSISDLPGLDADSRDALLRDGIDTTGKLLQHKSRDRQNTLAARLRVHPQHLRKWMALADLAQIPTVGCQYCGLLLHAGVASPQQLATTPVGQLHRQLVKLHVATLRDRQNCPSAGEVRLWIQQAQQLTSL